MLARLFCGWLTACCLGIATLTFVPSARAQGDDPWEVMRVYFDSKYIGRVVSDSFTPIAIDELSDLLKRLERLRNRSNQLPPHIHEAQYVASLSGDRLHSERSCWVFESEQDQGANTVNVGRISVVPTRGRSAESSEKSISRQLVDFDQYTTDGDLVLGFDPEFPSYAFGFYALGSKSRGEVRFEVELPSVTKSQLLIATPQDIELHSSTAAVEPATEARLSEFDEDLKSILLSRMDEATRLWVVNNSGLSQFTLTARKLPTNTLAKEPPVGLDSHVVSTSRFEYRVSPDRTEVTAEFELLPGDPDAGLQLDLSSDLRILDAVVNESPVEFYSVASFGASLHPSETSDDDRQVGGSRSFVELAAQPSAITGTTIRIQAICPRREPERQLPSINLASAYCLSGTTKVIAEGLVVSQITQTPESRLDTETESAEAISVGTDVTLSPVNAANETRQFGWSTRLPIRWHGAPPRLRVSLAKQRQPWRLESVSQVRVQSEWLTLTCNAKVRHSSPSSNELSFQVPDWWLIDSVSVKGGSADSRFKAEKIRRDNRAEIRVTWDDTPEEIEFDIQVRAHMPRRGEQLERLSIFAENQLYVPGAEQVEFLVIAPGPLYDIEINESSLKRQVQPTDLPPWQQALIEPAAELWFFERLSPQNEPIELSPSRGGFNSEILTVLDVNDTGLEGTTKINVRPLAGATTSVSVLVPAILEPTSIKWSLDESAIQLDQSSVGAAAQGSRLVRLKLGRPLSRPFQLTAKWRIQREQKQRRQIPSGQIPRAETEFKVPVLAISGAIESRSTLIAPSTLRLKQPPVSVQVQGSASLPGVPQSESIVGQFSSGIDYRRYNLNSVAAFELEFISGVEEAQQHIMVHRQFARHTVGGNGEVTHDISWFCQTGAAAELKLKLPAGWQAQSLLVDSAQRSVISEGGSVVCELPPQADVVVSLRCTSSTSSTLWWQNVDCSEPDVDAAVVTTDRVVRLPHSAVPVRYWMYGQEQGTLLDRLVPYKLWANLGPSLSPNPDRWTEVELPIESGSRFGGEERSPRVLLIARKSSLAAMAMAAMLAFLALSRWILPQSFHWWFLVLFTLAIAVVLAPRWILVPLQIVYLGVCCAAVLRVLHPLFQLTISGANGDQSRLRSGKASAVGALFMLVGLQSTVYGQEYPQAVDDSTIPKTYSVLIPTTETEDGQTSVDGAYAYAPKALLEKADLLNSGATPETPPRITAIDYQIRLRRSALDPMRRMVEFQVDLRVEFPREDASLSLPLGADQVELQSATVDGIGVPPGGRVQQTQTEIVLRPRVSGLVAVQLKFTEFDAQQIAGKGTVLISVAPLPLATLRVVSDGQQDLEIRSVGPIQRSMASTVARIGSVDAIDISWTETARQPASVPAQNSANLHTWLHAGLERLVAVARLAIPKPPANREIEVIIDSAWTPVGSNWGDGHVIDSELIAPVGIQKRYRLRLDPSEMDGVTLEVLLVPRNLERTRSLAVPFLTSKYGANASRNLSWSSVVGAQWKPEGLGASWQPADETNVEDWGALRLFEGDVATFQSSSEGQAPTVRRILAATPQTPSGREINVLHLGDGYARLNYSLKFDQATDSELVVITPPGAQVSEVTFDGVETTEFVLASDVAGDKLILKPSIECSEFSVSGILTTQLNTLTSIPRFSFSNRSLGSSTLQIFRGAGLVAELQSESPLFQELSTVPNLQLLQDFEVPLAEVEIPTRELNQVAQARYSVGEFRLSQRPNTDSASLLFQLQQTDAGWVCTLHCVWTELSSALDIACFEIPAAFRDALQFGNLPRRFVPSGSPDALTLCLIPPSPTNGRSVVSFSFPVASSTSSQSISMPKIALLTGRTKERLLLLPKELNAAGQQEVVRARWTQVGAEVTDPVQWSPASELPGVTTDRIRMFQMLSPQTQVSWERNSAVQPATILHRELVLTDSERTDVRGSYEFWVEPAGQTEIKLELPPNCEILAATRGGRLVGWNKAVKRGSGVSVNLQLSPNYLPVHFELLLRWQVDPEKPTLDMPEIATPVAPPKLLVSSAIETVGIESENVLAKWNTADRARRWAEVVNDSFGSLVSLEPVEVETWMRAWQPTQLGVPLDAMIALTSADGLEEGNLPTVSAADFWAEACSNFELPLEGFELTPSQVEVSSLKAGTSYQLATPEVRLVVAPKNSQMTQRTIAATMLLCVLGGVLLLKRQIGSRFMNYQALHPWSYWLVLAVILAVVSPVLWPAIVVTLLSLYSGVTQFIDAARRRRSLNGQRLA